MFIPMGAGNLPSSSITTQSIPRYDTGGGADLGFELDISSIWSNPFGIGYS